MRRALLAMAALIAGLLSAVALFAAWRTADYGAGPALAAPLSPAEPYEVDLDGAAARLGEAIRFQTVTLAPGVVEDPAAFEAFRAWMAETYPALHEIARPERFSAGALLFRWTGSDPSLPPILLAAHQDVVPVEAGREGVWRAPPFSGALVGETVVGRGALDDKGSLIAILEAANALAADGFAPKRTILLAFGADEETGGSGAASIAAALDAEGVHPWFALDEGLVILADHPLTGGAAALIGIAEKGYATLRVTAAGAPGHSSAPPRDLAVLRLAEALEALAEMPLEASLADGPAGLMLQSLAPELPLFTRAALANEWLFGPMLRARLEADPLAMALMRTTVAPTMLEGSPKENVLPGEAAALVNLRLHPRDTAEEVLAKARAAVADVPGVTLAWEGEPREASRVSAVDGPAYALISALAVEAAEGGVAAPGLVLGGTDGRAYEGVAENVYRFAPFRLDTREIASIHGDDERVRVEELGRAIRFYRRLMQEAAG